MIPWGDFGWWGKTPREEKVPPVEEELPRVEEEVRRVERYPSGFAVQSSPYEDWHGDGLDEGERRQRAAVLDERALGAATAALNLFAELQHPPFRVAKTHRLKRTLTNGMVMTVTLDVEVQLDPKMDHGPRG